MGDISTAIYSQLRVDRDFPCMTLERSIHGANTLTALRMAASTSDMP